MKNLLLEFSDGQRGMTVYYVSISTPGKTGSPTDKNRKSWEDEAREFYDRMPPDIKLTVHYEGRSNERDIPLTITKTDLGKNNSEFIKNITDLNYYKGKLVAVRVRIFDLDLKYPAIEPGYALSFVISTVPLKPELDSDGKQKLIRKTDEYNRFIKDKNGNYVMEPEAYPDVESYDKIKHYGVAITGWAELVYNPDGTKKPIPPQERRKSHDDYTQGYSRGLDSTKKTISGSLRKITNNGREFTKEEFQELRKKFEGKEEEKGQFTKRKEKRELSDRVSEKRFGKKFNQLNKKEQEFILNVVHKLSPELENVPLEENLVERIINHYIKT